MSVTFESGEDLLVDRVVDLLRDRIIEARYAPGQALPRRQLAEELNLGATIVGEALRVLRREGLVLRGRRGEMRVASHARLLLLDALELRLVIDGLAARLAAQRGATSGAVEKALAEQRAAIASGETRRFRWGDIAFHAALLDCSGNVLLPSCVSFVRWTSRTTSWDARSMRLALADHEAILAAVLARNCDQAEWAAQTHVCHGIDEARRTSETLGGAPLDENGRTGR